MYERTKTPKKVTIKSVAKDAGVSVAAVSKVLRNAYGVSETLRGKVQKSIDDLGYRPSTAARGMRGKTYTVGMLLVDIANPFLPAVIDGVKAHLRAQNYNLMISVSDGRRHVENSLIESMIDMRMDGVILISPQCSAEILESYASHIPMVVVGHHVSGSRALDTINCDDHEGARIATEALINAGYRRIHMCSLPHHEGDAADVYHVREEGYLAAMQAADRSEQARIHRLSQHAREMEQDLQTLLTSGDLADALFCWSDIHAIALMSRAKALGLAIPTDLAIIGYDNSPPTKLMQVALASIDQSPGELGRMAAENLFSRIEGRTEPVHIRHPPRLVSRDSY